ncbi:MAG: trehalose-6-phosphate synthase [Tepidiformaceae bacterium]
MAGLDIVVANRAYLDHDTREPLSPEKQGGAGGLLAVMRPVIRPWRGDSGTAWVGAGRGAFDHEFVDDRGYETIETPRGPLRVRRVFVSDEEWDGHYRVTANSFLWPLLHITGDPLPAIATHYPEPATPSNAAWRAYVRTNRAFAAAALELQPARSCWVHDYQLGLVPAALREGGFAGKIGFFLHTPVPDIAVARPFFDARGRELIARVVAGILGADMVGLQCEGDVRRFKAAAAVLNGADVTADGLYFAGRHVRVSAHPVGIDVDEVLDIGRLAHPPARVASLVGGDIPLVVGLERADFTKGIPERLDALAAAYDAGARFHYAGYASPTRSGVEGYDQLNSIIEAKAAVLARKATDAGCTFFHAHESIPWEEVIALMRDADVVFTSSLSDGMNLVPLQAAAIQALAPEGRRATILCGRGAGVAETYRDCEGEGLLIVDPFDTHGMRNALMDAVAGRASRVSDLFIARIRERDAKHWATRYLNELMGECP